MERTNNQFAGFISFWNFPYFFLFLRIKSLTHFVRIKFVGELIINKYLPTPFKSSDPRCLRRLRGARGHELDAWCLLAFWLSNW